jgi:hypothetical protein
MKKIVFALILAMMPTCVIGSEHNAKLDKLGASLRYLRALPPGAKTQLRCPSHLERIGGMPIGAVVAALGKADHVAAGKHSWYLASPAPDAKRAAGFPIVTFSVNAGTVDQVSCSYAK